VLRRPWGTAIHFAAYRVHEEGTNRDKLIFQIFNTTRNTFNAVNVLIFEHSWPVAGRWERAQELDTGASPPTPSDDTPVLKWQKHRHKKQRKENTPCCAEHNSPTSFHSQPDDVWGYILFIKGADWGEQLSKWATAFGPWECDVKGHYVRVRRTSQLGSTDTS
jgi:hypothetical protein